VFYNADASADASFSSGPTLLPHTPFIEKSTTEGLRRYDVRAYSFRVLLVILRTREASSAFLARSWFGKYFTILQMVHGVLAAAGRFLPEGRPIGVTSHGRSLCSIGGGA
jgi:hypothetical protein